MKQARIFGTAAAAGFRAAAANEKIFVTKEGAGWVQQFAAELFVVNAFDCCPLWLEREPVKAVLDNVGRRCFRGRLARHATASETINLVTDRWNVLGPEANG